MGASIETPSRWSSAWELCHETAVRHSGPACCGRCSPDESSVERELDRELAFHLDQQAQESVIRGMSSRRRNTPPQTRSLGGLSQIQEECRDMRRTHQLETIWNDLKYAVRTLGRTPGFYDHRANAGALSIGADSAVFSVIQGVLLQPLPYANPDRLVRIYFQSDSQPNFPLNPNDFRDFREHRRNPHFPNPLPRWSGHDVQLSGAASIYGDAARVPGLRWIFQDTRRESLRAARDFTANDELAGALARVAMLSGRHLWREPLLVGPEVLLGVARSRSTAENIYDRRRHVS